MIIARYRINGRKFTRRWGDAETRVAVDYVQALRDQGIEVEVVNGRGPILATNEIKLFLHCARCLAERPENRSPRDWAQLEVGWTELGLQVWCKRHELNVLHVDFEGMKHPANTERLK